MSSEVFFKIMTSCHALGHYFKKASDLRHYPISASYPDVSLSRCTERKAGRRKRASPLIFYLPLVLCASLPVTRVLRSPLCKKLSACGGGGTFLLFYNQQFIIVATEVEQ